jgi:hypothetical protein
MKESCNQAKYGSKIPPSYGERPCTALCAADSPLFKPRQLDARACPPMSVRSHEPTAAVASLASLRQLEPPPHPRCPPVSPPSLRLA